MTYTRRHAIRHALAAGWTLGLPLVAAQAQPNGWPARGVRMIVPYAAGGPADLVARELGQVLADEVRQPVTIENMGGAMGVPALSVVARAEPDACTLVLAAVGNIVLQPLLSTRGGGDLVARLRPVGTVSTAPHVLVVSAKLPIHSVADLVAYARANPGRVSFASAGTGGTSHLGMEMFKSLTGTDVIHVPYKGSAGAFNDLISGQVTALFSSMPSLQGLIDKGYVRLIAATAPSNSPATRNVPLMSATIPGYDYSTWYAMYAPLTTPREVVDRANAALNHALGNAALASKVAAAGTELHPGTPDEVLRWTQRDQEKWSRIIRAARIQVDQG